MFAYEYLSIFRVSALVPCWKKHFSGFDKLSKSTGPYYLVLLALLLYGSIFSIEMFFKWTKLIRIPVVCNKSASVYVAYYVTNKIKYRIQCLQSIVS